MWHSRTNLARERAALLQDARRVARARLREHGVRAPEHIRLRLIASDLGVTIARGGLDGARARLCHGARLVIRLSDRVTHLGARRFSVAHELGHLVLRHPPMAVGGRCAEESIVHHQKDVTMQNQEGQADAFATEVTMPEELARPRCEVSPMDLRVAQSIERDFRVSILAGVIRVAELTSERCVAVFSRANQVQWARSSAAMPWRLGRRQPLDAGSVAADYFRTGKLDQEPQVIDVGTWFPAAEECRPGGALDRHPGAARGGDPLVAVASGGRAPGCRG